MKKLIILFLLCNHNLKAQVSWPAITQQTKPWTRWWWEGSAVDEKNLSWNLEQYQKAGLGGVEITPIYGVEGYESKFIDFLSPLWMKMFDHTLSESKRLGLGVDLANATGWPFGGRWVTDADASKTVYYKTWQLSTGSQLSEPVVYQQQALIRTANNKMVSTDTVLQPVSANHNLQSLALDQIIFPATLHANLLMAYSDRGDTLDLTSKLDAKGQLSWTAPQGNWTLYALFTGLHGKMVERAAPGGEGYAIDHFSAKAVQDYFKKFDEAFKGHDISYLRAFFNDSYEVDDARGQSNWTPLFLSEFLKRRGYDLRKHLPALFGKTDAETNSRVLFDYRSTIDELLLENFTVQWKKWGASKSALVRNQSHGSPANTLDLYSAVDIPETEGTDILRFKFATSAAHVSGKKLASSESATWLNEHFVSSLADVKKAIDLYFLGGVNHIFYHGTAYSPQEAPWPGWLFYAAVHFQPVNPQWKDFHQLNEYIARVQSFLQQGKPDNQVLLYYPLVDRYSEPGRDLLQHFDGMERNFEGTGFEKLSKWMLDEGYGFDFFSDRQLQHFTVTGSAIKSMGNSYQIILLPDNRLIPENSFQKLLKLAKAGATILVYKDLPEDVPGFNLVEKRRTSFHQMISQLKFVSDGKIRKALIEKGRFLMGDDATELMEAAGVPKENLGNGLSSVRRKNNDGFTWFINNRTNTAVNDWIELHADSRSVALFDPMSQQAGLARWKKEEKGHMKVYVQVQPFASVIIQSYASEKKGRTFPYSEASGSEIAINGPWQVEFLNGGPVLPKSRSVDQLSSWTDWEGEEVKNFSGTASYTTSFPKPASNASAWLLQLGTVNETAEVFLNGKKLATLIGPDYSIHISSTALKQTNELKIIVANLMANRIAYMDRNHLPWKIFYNTNMPARKRENVRNGLFDASSWKPFPSGLLGPVTLTPLRYE
ncbi:MAG: glycosyl hydrolase [Flavisolibacter sp.]